MRTSVMVHSEYVSPLGFRSLMCFDHLAVLEFSTRPRSRRVENGRMSAAMQTFGIPNMHHGEMSILNVGHKGATRKASRR